MHPGRIRSSRRLGSRVGAWQVAAIDAACRPLRQSLSFIEADINRTGL